MAKQKLTLEQLKEMIREAVRAQLKEQISGLPSMGSARTGGYVGGGNKGQQAPGANQWLQGGFNLDQLVQALKDEQDEGQKKMIKNAIAAKLKSAGW